MKQSICLIIYFGLVGVLSAQPSSINLHTEEAVQFSKEIKAVDLEKHLVIIASEEFEGRETGTDGQKKAAEYLAEVFDSYGLPKIGANNDYFQKIAFISENWYNISLSVQDSLYRHLRDYYAYPSTNINMDTFSTEEFLFLGYGIDDERYSDYAKVKKIEGKTILIFDGEPQNQDSIYLITNSKSPSEWSENWRKKLEVARANGVGRVLIIDRNFKKNVGQVRRVILNRRLSFGEGEHPEDRFVPNIFINSSLANNLLGKYKNKVIRQRDKINQKGKSKPVKFESKLTWTQNKRVNSLQGENILGYIEGSDPQKKEELIVVSAHYDHLGMRGDAIYYGADDNGSGTSTLLEVCQAFALAKKSGKGPKRSILFLLVSGEEKGLLGSEYYAENPIFPIENTVANVNVDMVGRVDSRYQDNPNYIYVIGSDRLSTELHQINEAVNEKYVDLTLDYKYNEDDDPNRYYYRSDHYNFAVKGIPAIFYFNGTHEDYHRTTDTVEKINYDKMEKIGRLVFFTTWELANRPERIKVDVVGRN